MSIRVIADSPQAQYLEGGSAFGALVDGADTALQFVLLGVLSPKALSGMSVPAAHCGDTAWGGAVARVLVESIVCGRGLAGVSGASELRACVSANLRSAAMIDVDDSFRMALGFAKAAHAIVALPFACRVSDNGMLSVNCREIFVSQDGRPNNGKFFAAGSSAIVELLASSFHRRYELQLG